MKKTNAMRMLDEAKIPYEVEEYDVDPEDLSGLHVAQTAALPPERVFKTIVLKGDRSGHLVVCLPVGDKIDLKKAAFAGPLSAAPIPQISFINGSASTLDFLAPVLLTFIIFFFTFILSGLSFLHERTSGTRELVFATPLSCSSLVASIKLPTWQALAPLLLSASLFCSRSSCQGGSFSPPSPITSFRCCGLSP
jgi:hypothetical protein